MNALPETPEANAHRIEETVAPLADTCLGEPVFLIDGDRTLTPDDTSRVFLSKAGIDPMIIKRRFQRDGYVFDAFHFHAKVHLELGEKVFANLATYVASTTPVYPGAADFLRSASGRGRVFIVSAGIPRIWWAILDLHGLEEIAVIGGIEPRNPYVFGRTEKRQVAELFLRHTTKLVGVGDSDVDTGMLQLAHHAVVVVNNRQNVDLVPHLANHPSVWQVIPLGDPHPGIRELAFGNLLSLID